MKQRLLIAALFMLGMVGAVQAQNNLKVGYMTVDYVLSQMPESKQIEADLKAYNDQLQNQLQSKVKEFEGKYKDYQDKQASMSDLIRKDKEKELENLQNSIQEFQRNSENSLRSRQQKALEPVMNKIQKAIDDVAKENGYTYIFNSDAGAGTTPILLHAPESDNVNNLVLKKMGVNPAPANAAQPAQPSAQQPKANAPANKPAPKK